MDEDGIVGNVDREARRSSLRHEEKGVGAEMESNDHLEVREVYSKTH